MSCKTVDGKDFRDRDSWKVKYQQLTAHPHKLCRCMVCDVVAVTQKYDSFTEGI